MQPKIKTKSKLPFGIPFISKYARLFFSTSTCLEINFIIG